MSSNINRYEDRRDSMNDMEKTKRNESLPIMVFNVPENQDCSLGKGKEEALCVTANVCDKSEEPLMQIYLFTKMISASFNQINSDPWAVTDHTSLNKVLFQLKLRKT